jgi:hypothetical protein
MMEGDDLGAFGCLPGNEPSPAIRARDRWNLPKEKGHPMMAFAR